MLMTPILQVIRSHEIHAILPLGRTAIDSGIAEGLIPPRIHLGQRAVGFLKHELEVIIIARATGRSDAEIKELVAQLVLSREVTLLALTKHLH